MDRLPYQRLLLVSRVGWGVVVCALMVCGCTPLREYWDNGLKVGPDYLRPVPEVNGEWIDADSEQIRSESPAEVDWWERFNDPVLGELVSRAYDQNLPLREAGFRVLASRAAYNIAVGGFFPQSQSSVSSFNRYQISDSLSTVPALQGQAFSIWQTGFNLSWELDLWGKIRRGIESSAATYQASVEEYDGVLVTLIADVAERYTQVRIAQKQVADLRRLAAIQRASLQLATDRFEGGATGELDVSQARLNLAQTEASIPGYEQQARVAANALCVLLAIPAEDLTALLGEGEIPVAPQSLAIGIPADLIRRRPDVRQMERLVAAQSAKIGVAEADLYPAFSINGYLGVYANELGELFQTDSTFGFVAPVVDWKVLNYGRILNNIRQQDARFQALAARYQNTVLQAGREAEDGIVTFIKAGEATTKQREALAAATRSVELVQIQYKEGSADFNRVFVVQKNQVEEQIRLNDNVGATATGMIQLYRALGGGWEIRLRGDGDDCCDPTPVLERVQCDDYRGKIPPRRFDAWCLWREWLRDWKPR
jgi:NodT family efflux transporter outer membrane factor (OMF) lipoprotein